MKTSTLSHRHHKGRGYVVGSKPCPSKKILRRSAFSSICWRRKTGPTKGTEPHSGSGSSLRKVERLHVGYEGNILMV